MSIINYLIILVNEINKKQWFGLGRSELTFGGESKTFLSIHRGRKGEGACASRKRGYKD